MTGKPPKPPKPRSLLKSATSKTASVSITPERRAIYRGWWQESTVGSKTIEQIANEYNEKYPNRKNISPRQVRHGMDLYGKYMAPKLSRADGLRKHTDAANNAKQILLGLVQKAMQEDADSGGKGVKRLKISKYKRNDGLESTTTEVKYESVLGEVSPLIRQILDWDKYEATLSGLMVIDEAEDVDVIDINLSGFFKEAYTDPADAPEVDIPDAKVLMDKIMAEDDEGGDDDKDNEEFEADDAADFNK